MAHPTLQFFAYSHLKEPLQTVSRVFHGVAVHMDERLPNNQEKTETLRKLLEAKDCAVRACLYREGVEGK